MKAAPGYARAHVNLGIGLEALGDADGAMRCFEAALAADASDPYATYNVGNQLYRRGELERPERLFRVALQSKPDFAEARILLGNLLVTRGTELWRHGQLDKAIACYAEAQELLPQSAAPRYLLGNALVARGRLADAVAPYRQALHLKPDFVDAYYGLGSALRHLGRHDEATQCFATAFTLTPDTAEGWHRLGHAFRDADRHQEGLECLRKALSLDPEHAEARWALAMHQLPAVYAASDDPAAARRAFSTELDKLDRWLDASRLEKGVQAVGSVQPFLLAYQEQDNRRLLEQHGKLCVRVMSAWAERQGLPAPLQRAAGGAVRVGVVSSFFSSHSVWSAIVRGWFSELDPQRVALHAFYLRAQEDDETRFARSRATHFESGARDLRQWADAILAQRLDVLVYPEIGMDQATLSLASLRLAPVQAAVWGHPETTGLPTVDYYLSGADFEPPDAQAHYTERLVPLPHLGCHYAAKALTPAEPDWESWGIEPANGLLVCPGVPFKYAPQHDALLAEIARRTRGSRLLFFTFNVNPTLSHKLRLRLEQSFAARGLRLADHVSFVPWQSGQRFYGVLARATVFLDTIGFSGFNTAMHAVECGLPIVTREGRFMRGRLASGILKRMGLDELVARSDEDYVSLAARLVTDPTYRSDVRKRIAAARTSLFEDKAPIRAMENFLVEAAR